MRIGLIGLGVMGRNIALNLRDAGHQPAVWDPWPEARAWQADGIEVAATQEALIASLAPPRTLLLMVKAGAPVTEQCQALVRSLSPGDRVIDGGNSFYRDSERHEALLEDAGIQFLGLGISGGAEGARHGPAMMAGGSPALWETLAPLLHGIAARAGDDPCAAYFGAGGAGHFVKMVHNGIEYAVMQAIAEACAMLTPGRSAAEVGETLAGWSRGPLAGYLLEITAEVFGTTDTATSGPLIEIVSDVAGHKGTGGWCVAAGLDYGIPIPAIAEAVALRQLSAQADLRAMLQRTAPVQLSTGYAAPDVEAIAAALGLTIRIALAQGLTLIAAASEFNGWPATPYGAARVWRQGSILRMALLDEVVEGGGAAELLCQGPVATELASLRRAVAHGLCQGLAVPVMAASLAYWNGLVAARLPTAVVQAQRDRFGAHGFARTDRPGSYHGPWNDDAPGGTA